MLEKDRVTYTPFEKGKFVTKVHNNIVLCEICGRETTYDATKRCDGCWDMEKGLRFFIEKDKEKAIKWLEDNLKKLR